MGDVDAPCMYVVKLIAWQRGTLTDKVPILLQDVNGPCPLLAIFNILLLRGSLSLPIGIGEISQVRCCM